MSSSSRQPLRIGRHLVICPSERCDPQDERIPLYLGRTRAFGSGLHETTVSCLEEIEALEALGGKNLLDVGCGTGILSVAALLLGARHATAFDIDPEAARACASNSRLNGVHDQTSVFCGTLEALAPRAAFALVLANIYGDIILEMADGIARRMSEGGTLILSGIAFEHMTEVRKRFEQLGLEQTGNRLMEDYVTMAWRKTVQDPKSKIQS